MKKLISLAAVVAVLGCSSGSGGTGGGVGGAGGTGGAGGSGGAGGTGGGSGGGSSEPTIADGCKDIVKAQCDFFFRCTVPSNPFTEDVRAFKTAAECYEKYFPTCAAEIARPGTTYTGADAKACATKLQTLTCTADPDFSCPRKLGTKADSANCFHGDECASGRCSKASTATCGTCIPALKEGDACTTADVCGTVLSADALLCVQGKCTATAIKKAGETCDPDLGQNCEAGAACQNNTCRARTGAGSACADAFFDCQRDLACVAVADAGTSTCQAFKLYASDEPCGFAVPGRVCPQGTFCITTPPTDGGLRGDDRCQAPAVFQPVGGKCLKQSEGEICQPGLNCGPNYICRVPVPYAMTCQ